MVRAEPGRLLAARHRRGRCWRSGWSSGCSSPTRTFRWVARAAGLSRVRDLAALPKAHLHLHFTGSMRPATLLDLAGRHGIRLPEALTSGRAAAAAGHRREGLVPVPAALRHRPVLRPGRVRRPAAGARGGRGRRPRRVALARAAGRPDVVRRASRRAHPDPRADPGRGPKRLCRNGSRHLADRGGQPDATPARRPDAGPAGRAARRRRAGRGGRLRAEQRRAAGRHERSSRGRSGSPGAAGLASVPHSGELLGPGPRADDAGLAWRRTGSATACGRSRTGPCSPTSSTAASPWRSARAATSRWASTRSRPAVPLRALRDAGRPDRPRRRRPAAVRLAAGRPVPVRPRGPRLLDDASWPSWPGARCAARARPTAYAAGLLGRHRRLARPRPAECPASGQRVRPTRRGSGSRADPEPVLHAVPHLPGQHQQVAGARAAAVGQGQRVLGRQRGRPGQPVALAEAGPLDQPGRAGLHPALGRVRRGLPRPASPARAASRAKAPRRQDRVGEERPGAPGVVVGRVEHHAARPPLGQHGLPGVGQRHPRRRARPPAPGPGRRTRSAPDRSPNGSWNVTSSTTYRLSVLNSELR